MGKTNKKLLSVTLNRKTKEKLIIVANKECILRGDLISNLIDAFVSNRNNEDVVKQITDYNNKDTELSAFRVRTDSIEALKSFAKKHNIKKSTMVNVLIDNYVKNRIKNTDSKKYKNIAKDKITVVFNLDTDVANTFKQYCENTSLNKSLLLNRILSDFINKNKLDKE